jgi:hypothetical protein
MSTQQAFLREANTEDENARLLGATVYVRDTAVVFTLSENKFNLQGTKWKSWLLVLATWLAGKVVFVTGTALVAGATK